MSKTVAIVSTSLSAQSRSRVAASYIAEQLSSDTDISVEIIDLLNQPLAGYPLDADNPRIETYKNIIEKADAVVIAYPVHNWGESGQTREFLSYVLDKKTMKNKVCLLIAGCSTRSSYTAFSSIAKTLMAEIQAVVLGAALLACGDDINKETGEIAQELKERLDTGAKLVSRFAKA